MTPLEKSEMDASVRQQLGIALDSFVPDVIAPDPPSNKPRGYDPIFDQHRSVERLAPHEYPGEIIVDTDVSPTVVRVRHCGFVWSDEEGVHHFVGTDGSSAEGSFTVFATDDTFELGDSVWACLDVSDPLEPVATLETAALTASPTTFCVIVGKISAAGSVEQYVRGFIQCAEYWKKQLDHSFLPTHTPDAAEENTKVAAVSPGRVVFRDGTLSDLISPAAVDFSTNDKFWLVIDYTSTPTAGPNLTGGTSWPSFLDATDDKVNVPVFEFVGNEFSGLVRHQTNDIIDTRRELPDGNVPSTVRKSLERSTTADAGKDAFQMRLFDDSGTTICKVPHVKTVAGVKDIEWRVPVTGPGTAPGTLDSYVITGITSGSSGDATASFTIKRRSHKVENGDEVWGAEEGTGEPGSGGTDEPITITSNPIAWSGGTLYQVWQVKSGGYGWDWVRAHG